MSSILSIIDTPLHELKLIQRHSVGDNRGYFERMFCGTELRPLMLAKEIVQINYTLTVKRGTLRGLHFQYPPYAETKIVSCLRGEVFDVAVDLRQGSQTFLQWHGEILSADNHRTLLIPEGFAHGFQALTDECGLLYFHSSSYQPNAEGGLNARDPRLAIRWPEPVADISPRDAAHPFVTEAFVGVVV
jgi:dTDP-4-dehydrorhamnose 3,5-epimerase